MGSWNSLRGRDTRTMSDRSQGFTPSQSHPPFYNGSRDSSVVSGFPGINVVASPDGATFAFGPSTPSIGDARAWQAPNTSTQGAQMPYAHAQTMACSSVQWNGGPGAGYGASYASPYASAVPQGHMPSTAAAGQSACGTHGHVHVQFVPQFAATPQSGYAQFRRGRRLHSNSPNPRRK